MLDEYQLHLHRLKYASVILGKKKIITKNFVVIEMILYNLVTLRYS
jgi:hypothetical protein